jgi:uncharacterized phage protein (TIGR02216 family)
LKLSPATFWSLSFAEWRALTGARAALAPLSAGELAGLMRRYPD